MNDNLPIPSINRAVIKGACPHDCPDTCALEYHVEDGKLVDVKGSATHSVTGGVLCTKVAKYPLRTYHPTRVKTPLKRIGAKGEGKFAPISWDEALDTIASKFKSIIAEHGAEAILPYSYAGNMGILQYASMDRRFFHALGASQLDRTICSSAGGAGLAVTLGSRLGTDVEAFAHSEVIILWGTNPITSNLHLWSRCQEAKRRGAKLIAIDPYRSLSAEKCHQWLAIKPGTDAALALAMMHVLVRENLLDHAYIAKHTLGFAELKSRVAERTPERAAAICGISAADIEALAKLYGSTKRAAIRLNYGMQRHGGGGMAVRTVACLPALTGAWTEASGGLLLSTSGAYPMDTAYLERPDLMPRDANGKLPRLVNMCEIGDALTVDPSPFKGEAGRGMGFGSNAEENHPHPHPPLDGEGAVRSAPLEGERAIHALFVYNSNPAAVAPDGNKVLAGLAREDLFTVVHDIFITDTARYADIVLPATTQPEHDDIHRSYGHYDIVLNRRAIDPVGESLANTEVFRRLAKLMGLSDPCLSESDESMIAHAFDWNHPTLAGQSFSSLERDGFLRLNYPKKDGFITPFLNGGFGTPSGKCEFYSETLAKRGLDPLPNYTPPHEGDESEAANEYPLSLNTPPARNFMNSTFANIEELAKPHGAPTVQIHPNDAAPRNISNDDKVRVWNGRGEMKLAANVTDDTREGVATILWGHWRDHPGTIGFVNDLTSQALTDIGNGATFYDCRVEIEIA